MQKEFLQCDAVRNNAIKLAHTIYKNGFVPDVIYASLRGGAYVGNCISEYYKIVRGKERPVCYAAVVVRSYADVAQSEKIRVDGWTYPPECLRTGDKVLLVDDIFDTGKTINHLANIILDHGIPRRDLKVAVHDYKYFYDKPEQLPIQPDYWCRMLRLSIKDEPMWIHYMSHELIGLTREELELKYYASDPSIREALNILE